MKQVRNSFDIVTLRKIGISLILSIISSLGSFLVAYSQTQDVNKSLLISLGAFGGFITNVVREYISGDIDDIKDNR